MTQLVIQPRRFQERARREALDPTQPFTREDVILSAGWYEGEGSVVLNNRAVQVVMIFQKDDWMLLKLRDWFGGSLGTTAKGHHHWRIIGGRARDFLSLIYPYLSPRRQQQILDTLIYDTYEVEGGEEQWHES